MKKNIYLTLTAFVLVGAIETLINQVLLKETYNGLAGLWRPAADLTRLAPLFLPIYIAFAAGFTMVFTKAYRGNGLIEGALIGAGIGLVAKLWYGYTNYIVLPIPPALAFQWFFYGLLETLVIGMIMSKVADAATEG